MLVGVKKGVLGGGTSWEKGVEWGGGAARSIENDRSDRELKNTESSKI